MLSDFAAWLGGTPLSQLVGATLWVVPVAQSLHILAICAVMASAWIVAFRIIGIAGHDHTLSAVSGRLGPWTWRALVVLLATGVVLIVGEPARELTNRVFFAKMGLLVAAAVVSGSLQHAVTRHAAAWDRDPGPPPAARIAAALSLILWLAIVVAGRWIAYADHA